MLERPDTEFRVRQAKQMLLGALASDGYGFVGLSQGDSHDQCNERRYRMALGLFLPRDRITATMIMTRAGPSA